MKLRNNSILLLFLIITFSALGQSFTELSGPYGGRVSVLKYDAVNLKLYAIVNGRLFVSADNGVNWTLINAPGGGANDVITDGSKLITTVNNNFHSSTDGGQNWTTQAIPTSSGNLSLQIIKYPTPGVYLLRGNGEVRVTVDGGVNWKTLLSYATNGAIVLTDLEVTSTGDIFLADGDVGLRKYPKPADPTNLTQWSDANWTTVFTKKTANTDGTIQIGIDNADRIFINHLTADLSDTNVQLSTDNGATWQLQQPRAENYTPGPQYQVVWASSPSGKMYYIMNSVNQGFYEYTAGAGTPWTTRAWPTSTFRLQNVFCAVWRSNTQVFAGSEFDGVFASSNTGASWAVSSAGLNFGEGRQVEITVDGKIIVVQGQAPSAYWYTTDQGLTWVAKPFPSDIAKLHRLPDNTLLIIPLNALKTYWSTDGLNWTENATAPGMSYIDQIFIVATNNIYAFDRAGAVWTSLDKGVTWNQVEVANQPTLGYRAVTRDDNGYFYVHNSTIALNSPKQFSRFDSNVTPWTRTNFTLDGSDEVPASMFTLNNKLYAVEGRWAGADVRGGNLKVSTDKGETWTDLGVQAESGAFPLRLNALSGIVIPHEGYVSITQTEGKTVLNIPIQEPNAIITDIALNAAGTKYVASSNGSASLEFVLSPTNKLLVAVNEIPTYIDFGWSAVAGGPFGGPVKQLVSSSTGQLFALGGSDTKNVFKLYRYNASSTAWDVVLSNVTDPVFIDASDKIYARTLYSSLNVSSDNGSTFTTLSSFDYGQVYKILKNDVGDILATTSSYIIRSTDGGLNFTIVNTGQSKGIVMIPDGTLVAIQNENVIRSTDKGVTWTVSNTGIVPSEGWFESIVNLGGSKIGLVKYDNLYVSSDGGLTWTSILNNLSTEVRHYLSLAVSPAGHYYATMANNDITGSNVFVSTNEGTSWSKKGTTPFLLRGLFWNGSSLLASTYNDGILTSTDDGATFSILNANKGFANNNFTGLEIFKSKLFTVSNNKLYESDNYGQTFSEVSFSGATIAGLLPTPDGALIAYGANIYKTNDGVTWTLQKAAVNFTIMSVSANSLYYGYGNKFQSSTDFMTWTDIPATGLPQIQPPTSMVSAHGVLYFTAIEIAGFTPVAYQYSSGTFTKLTLPTGFGNLKVNFVAQGDKVFMYATLTAGDNYYRSILKTTTDGIIWTSKVFQGGNKFMLTNNYMFVTQNRGGLFLSRDQGSNWQGVGLPVSAGVNFDKVIIDEFSGVAYAIADGNAILKSSGMVLLNDNRVPLIATVSPSNLATGVEPSVKLVITFDEAVTPVAGKKIKIVDPANSSGFVESIDVSLGVQAQRSFTFTPAQATLKYSPTASALQSYFITLDPGAFVDLFANPTNAVINDATWKFTMAVIPDQTAPVITFDNTGTTNYLNIQDNNKAIRATITDAVGVTQSQIYYRPITSDAAEIVSQLTKTTGDNYEFSVPSSAYGPIGLEFYLTASDAAGNSTRSPLTGYYYAYKAVTTVKPTLASALPAGSVEDNYRMISIPYVSDKTVETVLIPALSQFDAKIWRLFTLNNEKTDWSEYPNDFTTLETGKGYWIIYKNGGALALGVESTPIVTKETPTTIILTPGWNQIGNPYPFPMTWSQVLTANNNPAGLTSKPKVYRGGGTGYTEPDVIGVTEGFLVKNTGTSNIVLNIPLVSSSSGARMQQISSTLDESEWRLPLMLFGKSFSNTIGGIGMSPEANESVDGEDDFSAPSLQNMLQLDFPHPEHSEKVLARDVVNTQKDYTWNFKVNTNLSEEITLQWDNENFGNNSKELFLFDVAKQLPVNMRELTQYSFNPAVSASFRIYFGENVISKIEPDLVLLGQAFPNPSEGETTIPIVLPGGIKNTYQVRLAVYNLYGEKIATIYEGEMKGGFHSVKWNTGSAPSGLHLYKLAVSPSTQSVQTQKIILK